MVDTLHLFRLVFRVLLLMASNAAMYSRQLEDELVLLQEALAEAESRTSTHG